MPGVLYVVSTPIGNLDDITLRALRVLGEVDVIAAEDTRHSRKLLTHHGIAGELISYWGEREKSGAERVLTLLREGKRVALISDAGTPGMSDPGQVLIRRAIEAEMEVVTVPGPSALIAALTVSGLPTGEFLFLGFAPVKKNERRKFLRDAAMQKRTVVFYEAPHRLIETLREMEEIAKDRSVAVCHELTKFHESVLRGTVGAVLTELLDSVIAGEYVIVLEGMTKEITSYDEALSEVMGLMQSGMGRKEAVRIVAEDYGMSRKDLYERSLGKSGLSP